MAVNNNQTISKIVGPATAYAEAVVAGFVGTKEEWAAYIANASSNAQAAQNNALKSEGYAVGKQNGVNVDSQSPYYENNADYFAGQAKQSADDAEGSKLAIEGMTVVAVTLPAGSAATVTKTVDPQTGAVTLTFGVPKGADGETPTVPVQDVQIDGTSILQNGIANIPKAVGNDFGLVALKQYGGLIFDSEKLGINFASSAVIKAGVSGYALTTPSKQHEAIFWGLAKLAGVDLASGSYTVGVYPDNAKSAISQMLNGSVSVSGSTPSITALPGVRYVCGEVSTLDITLPASGDVEVIFESGSTATVLTVTPPSGVNAVQWANGFDPTSLEADTRYDLIITDGEWGLAASWA